MILLHCCVVTIKRSGNGYFVPTLLVNAINAVLCELPHTTPHGCTQQEHHSVNQQAMRPSPSKDHTPLTSGTGRLQINRPNTTTAPPATLAPRSLVESGIATDGSGDHAQGLARTQLFTTQHRARKQHHRCSQKDSAWRSDNLREIVAGRIEFWKRRVSMSIHCECHLD